MPDAPITITTFDDRHAADFDRLNRRWLEAGGFLEPLDEHYLANPRGAIIEAGGEVFLALRDGEVVGTVAAIPWSAAVMELAKLTVTEAARGAGLGQRLCEQVIAFAQARGASRVVLTSNTALTTAVALYRRLGFVDRPPPPEVGYATADVYMELDLPVPVR